MLIFSTSLYKVHDIEQIEINAYILHNMHLGVLADSIKTLWQISVKVELSFFLIFVYLISEPNATT